MFSTFNPPNQPVWWTTRDFQCLWYETGTVASNRSCEMKPKTTPQRAPTYRSGKISKKFPIYHLSIVHVERNTWTKNPKFLKSAPKPQALELKPHNRTPLEPEPHFHILENHQVPTPKLNTPEAGSVYHPENLQSHLCICISDYRHKPWWERWVERSAAWSSRAGKQGSSAASSAATKPCKSAAVVAIPLNPALTTLAYMKNMGLIHTPLWMWIGRELAVPVSDLHVACNATPAVNPSSTNALLLSRSLCAHSRAESVHPGRDEMRCRYYSSPAVLLFYIVFIYFLLLRPVHRYSGSGGLGVANWTKRTLESMRVCRNEMLSSGYCRSSYYVPT